MVWIRVWEFLLIDGLGSINAMKVSGRFSSWRPGRSCLAQGEVSIPAVLHIVIIRVVIENNSHSNNDSSNSNSSIILIVSFVTAIHSFSNLRLCIPHRAHTFLELPMTLCSGGCQLRGFGFGLPAKCRFFLRPSDSRGVP